MRIRTIRISAMICSAVLVAGCGQLPESTAAFERTSVSALAVDSGLTVDDMTTEGGRRRAVKEQEISKRFIDVGCTEEESAAYLQRQLRYIQRLEEEYGRWPSSQEVVASPSMKEAERQHEEAFTAGLARVLGCDGSTHYVEVEANADGFHEVWADRGRTRLLGYDRVIGRPTIERPVG